MGISCVKEPTGFPIPEFFDHRVCQCSGLLEPVRITRHLKQHYQSIHQASVILEVSIKFRLVVLVSPEQQAVPFHISQDKLSVSNGGLKEVAATKDHRGFGEAHQH